MSFVLIIEYNFIEFPDSFHKVLENSVRGLLEVEHFESETNIPTRIVTMKFKSPKFEDVLRCKTNIKRAFQHINVRMRES